METTTNFGINVSRVENESTPSAVAMTVLTTMFVIIAYSGLRKGFHYSQIMLNSLQFAKMFQCKFNYF